MASKATVQPTVNAMRAAADKLMTAAKLLENNHVVIRSDVADEAVASYSMIDRAIAEYTDGIAGAVRVGHELGREAAG
jgi:hypothetical protein